MDFITLTEELFFIWNEDDQFLFVEHYQMIFPKDLIEKITAFENKLGKVNELDYELFHERCQKIEKYAFQLLIEKFPFFKVYENNRMVGVESNGNEYELGYFDEAYSIAEEVLDSM